MTRINFEAFGACKQALAPLNLNSKEAGMTAAGAITFAVSTVILTYLLIAQPGLGIVGFSVLETITVVSLITTIVGLVLHSIKQRKALDNNIEEVATAPEVTDEEGATASAVTDKEVATVPEVTVEEGVLEKSEIAPPDYIEQVRLELPLLFDGLETLLKAFVEGYYISIGKKPQNLDKIQEALKVIRTQINEFLQNPQEVLRVAVGIAAYTLIDEKQMGELLKKSDADVIKGLPISLATDETGFEKQVTLTCQILQALCTQAKVNDETLKGHIKEVRNNYNKMLSTRGGDEEAKTNYQVALIEMIDYLYTHATLSEQQIEAWTSQLIPSFLENWRGSLFTRIDMRMKSLHEAFDKDGLFNDGVKKAILLGGRTVFGRLFVDARIQKRIASLPLIPKRKAVFKTVALDLFDAFVGPIVDGLFAKDHLYRKKVQEIINAQGFSPPKVEGTKWKPYIEAYAKFFTTLAAQIKA